MRDIERKRRQRDRNLAKKGQQGDQVRQNAQERKEQSLKAKADQVLEQHMRVEQKLRRLEREERRRMRLKPPVTGPRRPESRARSTSSAQNWKGATMKCTTRRSSFSKI